MNCESCRYKTPSSVPYIAHEAEMARMERVNKRLTALTVLEAVALALVVLFLH